MDPVFLFRSSGPCQNDDRLIGIEIAELLHDRDHIQFRHVQIKHHDIGVFAAKELQALPTTIGEYYVIALSTKERVEETQYALLIINDKHFGHDTSQNKHGEVSTSETAR